VAEVYEKYSHDGDLSSYVQTATMEVFKAVTAEYTAPDLIAQRSKVSGDINALLSSAEQKQKVAIAEAEASAVRATADGEADAQLKLATAKADAIKVQAAALAAGSKP